MKRRFGTVIAMVLCFILTVVSVYADDGKGQNPDYVTDYYMIVQSTQGGVDIYDEAEVENAPYNINHKKDILIFAVIGIVLAFGYVLVANMLDTTIKSVQDIEKIPGATVLASIPVYDLTESKGRRGGKR